MNRSVLRTGSYPRVNDFPVLFPLHPYTPRVVPISRVTFVHFVQSTKPQPIRGIGNVFAKGPPQALRALNSSLPSSVRALRVDVDRVDACPTVGTRINAPFLRMSKHVRFVWCNISYSGVLIWPFTVDRGLKLRARW